MLTDVQGQDDAVQFLRRVASQKYTSPLLLVGDEGVGRRFSVIQLTKELFCTGSRNAGCQCYDCLQINEGNHSDFVTVESIDDKEISVDQIREMIDACSSYPATAPVKVILVDGADCLTTAASNAILKTLEEPPATVRFFLLAENEASVIPTIRSRCGLVRFRRLPESFVASTVQQFESDHAKALVYARMAEGSVGRAIRFWGSGKIGLRDRILSLLSAGVQKDLPSIFAIVKSVEKELPLVLKILEQLLHDLLMLRHEPDRMIHRDLSDTLVQMQTKLPVEIHQRLIFGLRSLLAKSNTAINLPFHVQTYFVEAFFGV